MRPKGAKGHFNRYILASTSTLKSPLSPRPSLTPSLSRETASAIKLLMLTNCYDSNVVTMFHQVKNSLTLPFSL